MTIPKEVRIEVKQDKFITPMEAILTITTQTNLVAHSLFNDLEIETQDNINKILNNAAIEIKKVIEEGIAHTHIWKLV